MCGVDIWRTYVCTRTPNVPAHQQNSITPNRRRRAHICRRMYEKYKYKNVFHGDDVGRPARRVWCVDIHSHNRGFFPPSGLKFPTPCSHNYTKPGGYSTWCIIVLYYAANVFVSHYCATVLLLIFGDFCSLFSYELYHRFSLKLCNIIFLLIKITKIAGHGKKKTFRLNHNFPFGTLEFSKIIFSW